MNTYNITPVLYEEIAERCADNANFFWDCIELENGFAIVFASRNGKPYDVEVMNEDDEVIENDFNYIRYEETVKYLF